MFTINLSTGHERTLYAFLITAINCRLLEPALKQLAQEFSVVNLSSRGGRSQANGLLAAV